MLVPVTSGSVAGPPAPSPSPTDPLRPAGQAGRIITRQDRRDCTGGEVVRAVTRLGFTRHGHPERAPVDVPTPLRTASALLGGAASAEVRGRRRTA
ncbi:SCO5918 family protein [Streptomyces sp. enrichment culture]|uniref:SCO5918 family protein n=1 Tax=Streptomyces sp. enrichment culture TaxID=1795815 RepID=UPI003F57062B